MTKKVRNLIDKVASREVLNQAADDALDALDDKNVWYANDFRAHREESLDAIQNMIILGEYPTKEYKSTEIDSKGKKREIFPLYFEPWSILFHAIKIILEPIVERVLIYDSSAGRPNKGQTFGAIRTKRTIRRYKKFKYIVQSDLRKFYPSIPHDVVLLVLGRFINDDLFLKLIDKTILDYESDVEPLLEEEYQRKMRYCKWASKKPRNYVGSKRGITIGGCNSQLIGNLVWHMIDRYMTQTVHSKGYHRHCDDDSQFAETKERATYLLNKLDEKCNEYGLCIKASSYIALLKDEEKGIDGRCLDFVGYAFSKHNMRVRKRTKVKCAKAFHRVKSRKRRQELYGAYNGIMKWGKCKNLWHKILVENNMSFKEHGITTDIVSTDKNGKRIFNVEEEKIANLAQRRTNIVIHDFETNCFVKGKGGRCFVLYRDARDADEDCNKKKFCTTSDLIIGKLTKAREMNVLPEETFITQVFKAGGRYTYDIE